MRARHRQSFYPWPRVAACALLAAIAGSAPSALAASHGTMPALMRDLTACIAGDPAHPPAAVTAGLRN